MLKTIKYISLALILLNTTIYLSSSSFVQAEDTANIIRYSESGKKTIYMATSTSSEVSEVAQSEKMLKAIEKQSSEEAEKILAKFFQERMESIIKDFLVTLKTEDGIELNYTEAMDILNKGVIPATLLSQPQTTTQIQSKLSDLQNKIGQELQLADKIVQFQTELASINQYVEKLNTFMQYANILEKLKYEEKIKELKEVQEELKKLSKPTPITTCS